MAWFRIKATFGPGHQSKGEHYEYLDYKPTRDDLSCLFDRYFGEYDWPIGKVTQIRKPPRKYLENMASNLGFSIKRSQKMLDRVRKLLGEPHVPTL